MVRHTLRRVGAVVGAAAVVLLATALPAAAHVTVNPKEAAQGGYAKLAFRVPNERPQATEKVEVAFPAGQPLASVSVRPTPGWRVVVTKRTLDKPLKVHGRDLVETVDRITWTAESAATAIEAGEFQEFEVSAGPLPEDADKLVFKALQTYTGGEVVRWIDEPTGAEEPEHPAPTLTLTKAENGDDSSGTEQVSAGGAEAGEAGDDGPSGVAIAGLVAGIAGLVLGAVALVRTRGAA
jgi:uncharacterized protein YcnI